MKKVTKEEFEKFIRDYPKPLVQDVYAIAEPPILQFNDFSEGKVWPESVVASECLDWEEPHTYSIK